MRIGIIFSFVLIFSITNLKAQQATVSAGGDDGNSEIQVEYAIGQVFTVNQDTSSTFKISEGIHQSNIISVSTEIIQEENLLTKINVYPNPTENMLSIQGSGLDLANLSYTIIDYTGKVILDGKIMHSPNINLATLSSGVYFLVLKNESSVVSNNIKIIKN